MDGVYCLVGRATIPLVVAVKEHYSLNNKTCLGECEHFKDCSLQHARQSDETDPDTR